VHSLTLHFTIIAEALLAKSSQHSFHLGQNLHFIQNYDFTSLASTVGS
jgi:hypothetical protein